MPFVAVEVEGLADVNRQLRAIDNELAKNLHVQLHRVAEPIAGVAQRNAIQTVSGLRHKREVDWSEFRVGGTVVVYLVPARRGRNPERRRHNLAPLLEEAAQKAAERNEPLIHRAAEAAVDRSVREAGF